MPEPSTQLPGAAGDEPIARSDLPHFTAEPLRRAATLGAQPHVQALKNEPVGPRVRRLRARRLRAQIAPMSKPTAQARSLWRSPDFLKFWTGQSISKLGDTFTQLAMPLLILQLTHAPLALGIYTAAYYVPYLLVGLPAGALADRFPRRRLMIGCDSVRSLGLLLITALSIAGILTGHTIWIVYVVAVALVVATIFFDVAYIAAMPNMVEPTQLLMGNSYMQMSVLTSQLAGPPLAGVAVQFLGAARALTFDAGSFVVSAILLALIPREFRAEPARNETSHSAPTRVIVPVPTQLLTDIGAGIRFVWGRPVLRWTMVLIGANNLFAACILLTLFLFRLREQLHYSAGAIGIIYAFAALGGMAGISVAGRLRQSFALLPTALAVTAVISFVLITCALTLPAWIYLVAMAIVGMGAAIVNVNTLTLCQIVTPDQMLGRMQSVARLMTWSPIALGTVMGTALAGPFGAPAIIVAYSLLATGIALGMFLSPIRHVH